jgi:hypothetical protein
MSKVLRHTLSMWDRFNLIEKDIEHILGILHPPVPVPVPPVVPPVSVMPIPVVVTPIPTGEVITPFTTDAEAKALKIIFGK